MLNKEKIVNTLKPDTLILINLPELLKNKKFLNKVNDGIDVFLQKRPKTKALLKCNAIVDIQDFFLKELSNKYEECWFLESNGDDLCCSWQLRKKITKIIDQLRHFAFSDIPILVSKCNANKKFLFTFQESTSDNANSSITITDTISQKVIIDIEGTEASTSSIKAKGDLVMSTNAVAASIQAENISIFTVDGLLTNCGMIRANNDLHCVTHEDYGKVGEARERPISSKLLVCVKNPEEFMLSSLVSYAIKNQNGDVLNELLKGVCRLNLNHENLNYDDCKFLMGFIRTSSVTVLSLLNTPVGCKIDNKIAALFLTSSPLVELIVSEFSTGELERKVKQQLQDNDFANVVIGLSEVFEFGLFRNRVKKYDKIDLCHDCQVLIGSFFYDKAKESAVAKKVVQICRKTEDAVKTLTR